MGVLGGGFRWGGWLPIEAECSASGFLGQPPCYTEWGKHRFLSKRGTECSKTTSSGRGCLLAEEQRHPRNRDTRPQNRPQAHPLLVERDDKGQDQDGKQSHNRLSHSR